MQVQVKIMLKSGDVGRLKALRDALEPDNKGFPEGVSFESRYSQEGIVYIVKSSVPRLLSLRNTVDDILAHIETVESMLSAVDKGQGVQK